MRKDIKFSIVIAIFNGRRTLERCLRSIIDQSYKNFEIICYDGGSTDNSVEILQRYESDIAFWKSEPDRGIYHAWNKALLVTSGEYVCFIGCDDFFSDKNVLRTVVEKIGDNKPMLITSKILVIDKLGKAIAEKGSPWNPKDLTSRCNITHPGLFHHISLFKKYGVFNETYSIASDYEFLLRIKDINQTLHVDQPLVSMENAGISNTMVWKTLYETFLVQKSDQKISVYTASANFFLSIIKTVIKKYLLGRR